MNLPELKSALIIMSLSPPATGSVIGVMYVDFDLNLGIFGLLGGGPAFAFPTLLTFA